MGDATWISAANALEAGAGIKKPLRGHKEWIMKWIAVLAVSALWFIGTPELAFSQGSLSSLRCGSRLILIGETKADVAVKCGPPLYQQYVGERIVRTRYGYDKIIVEEWVYNFGPTDFLHTLRFEGGRLADIRRGERGY